ncbi:hypothetical protein HK405_007549, partial [Cladochytrium tenue]
MHSERALEQGETSPLLGGGGGGTRSASAETDDRTLISSPRRGSDVTGVGLPGIAADDGRTGVAVFWEEVWVVTKTSAPVAVAYMLQNSLQTGSVLIVGRMGADELAASAFAYMFAMVTAWVMALGSATALDTLCSQAWTGATNKTEVGVHLQRAIWVMTAMLVPIGVLWWNVEPVLLALGQDPQISSMTGEFLRVLLFGAPGYAYFEALKKFLQAQGIMDAGTYVLLVASPMNLALNYVL